MEHSDDQEIYCIFDNDNSTPIFDRDEEEDLEQPLTFTDKNIKLEQNVNIDTEMVRKIQKQVEMSKQNFFKVTVTREKSKSKPLNQNKQIESTQNNSNVLAPISAKGKNAVLKEGYLNKKTDGFFFKWHRRYMVLTSEKLYAFESIKKIELIGCVNLKLLASKLKQNSKTEIVLDFMGECENLILKADSEREMRDWSRWLKEVIGFQEKQKKVMIKTMVKPIYDSKDSVTEKEFIKTAETGDILLFYTKNTGAQLQRIFTNSDFDHVAMVVKFKKNELMVFESNQMYGVSVYDWRQYVQYFDLYQKITLRKLNYIKKADAQRQLLNFVKNNIGKKYEINVNKFITLESDVNWDKINQQKNKNRGYFCSQLIAKTYKAAGLLDSKKSSSRYWPVDFAEKSGLILKRNAFLEREQSILLNKHLKNFI